MSQQTGSRGRIEDYGHFLRRHLSGTQTAQCPPCRLLANGRWRLELAEFAPGGKPVVALHATSLRGNRRHRQSHRASLIVPDKTMAVGIEDVRLRATVLPAFGIGDAA